MSRWNAQSVDEGKELETHVEIYEPDDSVNPLDNSNPTNQDSGWTTAGIQAATCTQVADILSNEDADDTDTDEEMVVYLICCF